MFKIIAAIYFNRSANEFLRDELFTFTQFFRYFFNSILKVTLTLSFLTEMLWPKLVCVHVILVRKSIRPH